MSPRKAAVLYILALLACIPIGIAIGWIFSILYAL